MFKKGNITTINKNNDISYVAPLSYRHLRICGWFMMALMQLSIVFAFFTVDIGSSDALNQSNGFYIASEAIGFVAQLAVPFFLLANFALILSSQENIKKLVITHAALAIGVIIAFIVAYDRYIITIATKALSFMFAPEEVKYITDLFVMTYFTKYLSLNVFIDLLMCSLLYFFLIYKPKKIKKEHVIYFRLLVIIPIAYEVASAIIKGLSLGGLSLGANLFDLPIEVVPLLTNKPFVTFLAFLAIVIYLKYQENVYIKLGGKEENYNEFLETNAHTLQFNIVLGIIFAAAGLLDLIVTIILTFSFAQAYDIPLNSIDSFQQVLDFVQPWGFGKGIALLFFSPITLLFNYRKKYSDATQKVDLFIPLIGIAIVLLVFIEGFYQFLIR